jgi:hypothetical protein
MTAIVVAAIVLTGLWLVQGFLAWESRAESLGRVLGGILLSEILAGAIGVGWIAFFVPREPVEAPLPYIKTFLILEGVLVVCGLSVGLAVFLKAFFRKPR